MTRVSRLTETPEQQDFDEDDLYALRLLAGPLSRRGLESVLSASTARAGSENGRGSWPGQLSLSPTVAAAVSMLGVAVVKAQSRGRLSRQAHEWATMVIAFDLCERGDWRVLGAHVPFAIAAGIGVEAIEALRDGRLDDLEDEDRQQVDFVRAVHSGTVSDALWKRQIELLGGERAVVEQIVLALDVLLIIRVSQALGFPPDTTDQGLAQMLDDYRSGRRAPGDIAAYEAFFDRVAWPRLPETV
jgi:hypothetical protein